MLSSLRLIARYLAATLFSAGLYTAGLLATDKAPNMEIASMEIPFAYERNGTGVYNKIFDKLTEGYTGELNVSFYPSARYDRVMISRSADCDYIATDHLGRWEEHGVKAEEFEFIGPVNTLYVVLYIPHDAPDITTIEEVKKLVLASDINLVDLIHDLGIQEKFALQSQPQMLNLLAIRRITGLIGYDFDLDFLSKKLGVSGLMKKATIRLDSLNDGIVCFKNEKTAPFRNLLKSNFKKIQSSGWLKDALKDY
ncbi:MAG: hypothetical protein AB3N28_02685 [Kordiimonas sp.]